MSLAVHLVRHASHAEVGAVLSGRSGIALSAQGRSEAAALAEVLAMRGIAAIVSSPRPRAVETARIVAARLGLDVDVDADLDEIDFGDWTGRSFADLAELPGWAEWNRRRRTARPPGGESMAAATARAVACIGRIVAASSGPMLVVSHCDIIRGLIAHHIGLPLNHILRFDVDTASISTLTVDGAALRLTSLNERTA